MASLTVTLTGANSDEITLGTSATESDFILNKSVSGLALPSVSVRVDEGVVDGGYYISSRRLPRDIDLPITIVGTDEADVEDKFRRLAKLLSDRQGATRITVVYPDTSEWYIDGYYMSGGNVTYGDNAGMVFASLAISFRCPNPYWTDPTFLNATYTTLGTKSINNTGDIPAYPIWILTGPMTNITFTSPTGETWTYLASIPSGEIRYIDTYEKTVVDTGAINKYSDLGATPNLFPLPAGTNNIVISGGTLGGTIAYQFSPRKEVVF